MPANLLPHFSPPPPPPIPPFPLLQLVFPVRYVVVLQSIIKPCQRKSRYCSGTRGDPASDCSCTELCRPDWHPMVVSPRRHETGQGTALCPIYLHARTHARMHARTHARTHARAHARGLTSKTWHAPAMFLSRQFLRSASTYLPDYASVPTARKSERAKIEIYPALPSLVFSPVFTISSGHSWSLRSPCRHGTHMLDCSVVRWERGNACGGLRRHGVARTHTSGMSAQCSAAPRRAAPVGDVSPDSMLCAAQSASAARSSSVRMIPEGIVEASCHNLWSRCEIPPKR